METTIQFLDTKRVQIEVENGDRLIMGFSSTMNYQIEQQHEKFFSRCVKGLFEKHYDGDESVIWGPILVGMIRNGLNSFLWVVNDRDKERERLGSRIKELRKEQGIEAKELARRIGIDPGNLSRIEQGRFSVGIDILNKIAGAMNMKLDFFPKEEFDYGKCK